jgi:Flp pilus assembly protein CpaB
MAAIAVVLTVVAIRHPAVAAGSPVLVAAADVPGGTVLTPGHLRTVQMPGALLPAGSLGWPRQAVGQTLAAPLRRGEVVTDVRLLGPALLASVPVPGGGAPAGTARPVAAPVRIADPDAVGLLRVGDRVDVLAAATDGVPAPADPNTDDNRAPNTPTPDTPAIDIPDTGSSAAETPTTGGGKAASGGVDVGSGPAGMVGPSGVAPSAARHLAAVTVAADALVLALPRPAVGAPTSSGALVVLAVRPEVAAALAGAAATAQLSVVVRPAPGAPR